MKTITTKQDGSILLLVLVLLVLMTTVGVSAAKTVLFETRIAANQLDRDDAIQAAESGIALAEAYLHDLNGPVKCPKKSELSLTDAFPCESGTEHESILQPIFKTSSDDHNWWAVDMDNVFTTETTPLANLKVRYAIELVKRTPNTLTIGTTSNQFYDEHYRITSRGVGMKDTNAVVVQTVYYVRN